MEGGRGRILVIVWHKMDEGKVSKTDASEEGETCLSDTLETSRRQDFIRVNQTDRQTQADRGKEEGE